MKNNAEEKSAKKSPKIKETRKIVQVVTGLASNGYLKGFLNSSIYRGSLKRFCVPGLNCYSCPGALFACPIGSMQNFFAGRNRRFPAFIIGFLAAAGVLFGRFICGWLCLFGLIEELLYMIPVPKLKVPEKADRILRYIKYPVLIFLVILFPLIIRDESGSGIPFFCKYLCPAGTLEGALPLVLLNKGAVFAIGFLFKWKFFILVLIILSGMFIHRPFCKYLCPLGAFYALFNRISFLRLAFDDKKCIGCGKCKEVCKMQVDPTENAASCECIRCGECVENCPVKALGFKITQKNTGGV